MLHEKSKRKNDNMAEYINRTKSKLIPYLIAIILYIMSVIILIALILPAISCCVCFVESGNLLTP